MILRTWLALLALPLAANAAEVVKISSSEAAQRVSEGKAVLVDVREPAEWRETGVAAPALLLPKSEFDAAQKSWSDFLAQHRDREIILYCRTGRRSGAIAAALADKGFNVANAGGFKAWRDAGLPTRRVEK